MESTARIQSLIDAADTGSAGASEELFAALYAELHRLAEHAAAPHGAALSLGTTTLLHEAYLEPRRPRGVRFPDRARFMSYAARAMRGLVIDYVRRRAHRSAAAARTRSPSPATAARSARRRRRRGGAATALRRARRAGRPRAGAGRARRPALLLRLHVRARSPSCAASRSARCSATGARLGCCSTTRCRTTGRRGRSPSERAAAPTSSLHRHLVHTAHAPAVDAAAEQHELRGGRARSPSVAICFLSNSSARSS